MHYVGSAKAKEAKEDRRCAPLDKTDPEEYPEWAPTVAALLAMTGTHALMHCGQFVAVRRQLGKPVVI